MIPWTIQPEQAFPVVYSLNRHVAEVAESKKLLAFVSSLLMSSLCTASTLQCFSESASIVLQAASFPFNTVSPTLAVQCQYPGGIMHL